MSDQQKQLIWLNDTLETLKTFPKEVRSCIGHALDTAQYGFKHPQTKPLKGFKGASVLEVAVPHNGNAYRSVYTVELADSIYVLHVFQKKSSTGIKTAKSDIDLINQRLQFARQLHLEGSVKAHEQKALR